MSRVIDRFRDLHLAAKVMVIIAVVWLVWITGNLIVRGLPYKATVERVGGEK